MASNQKFWEKYSYAQYWNICLSPFPSSVSPPLSTTGWYKTPIKHQKMMELPVAPHVEMLVIPRFCPRALPSFPLRRQHGSRASTHEGDFSLAVRTPFNLSSSMARCQMPLTNPLCPRSTQKRSPALFTIWASTLYWVAVCLPFHPPSASFLVRIVWLWCNFAWDTVTS